MTRPVLMVADDDPGSRGTLDATLRRRYERDYLVIGESSPEAAIGRLRELQAAGHPVAVVMAAATLTAVPAWPTPDRSWLTLRKTRSRPSAGQAAVNLARYARQVTIVIRGDPLAARMSQYLIDEITATPNIDVRTASWPAGSRWW